MFSFIKAVIAFGICLASLLGYAETSGAQQNPVTAIDIALEPDQTMIQHAQADNARLLKAFPKGFALGATRHPHVTMLQQFVRTADLEKDGTGRREADHLEAEGVQVLLHSLAASRSCGHCG